MADHELTSEFVYKGDPPDDVEVRRIERQVGGLARRVKQYPGPRLHVVVERFIRQRRVTAETRLQLGPLGPSLVSHQQAETPARAIHAAISDLERQLERHLSKQRGDASFGVPSRRRFDPPLPAEAPEASTEA